MKISFNTELARKCGINAAIVADYLWHLIETDDIVECREDGIWVRCPMWQIRCHRPVLTRHQIERALRILREHNVIRSDQPEKKKFDHANWYRFTASGIELMEPGWGA